MPGRLAPERVFLDTSAFIALAKEDDTNHASAVAIWAGLRRARVGLVTTNYVVAETHALLLRYFGYLAGRKFLQDMQHSAITLVVRAEEDDEDAARAIIYRYTDKDFSFADAVSFAVMKRLRVVRAFTFDGHFSQYGVEVLRA